VGEKKKNRTGEGRAEKKGKQGGKTNQEERVRGRAAPNPQVTPKRRRHTRGKTGGRWTKERKGKSRKKSTGGSTRSNTPGKKKTGGGGSQIRQTVWTMGSWWNHERGGREGINVGS